MNILIDASPITVLPDHRSGLARYSYDLVKGLMLESETNKKANADGMVWTPEEIERTIVALREASEDDFKKFIQLLPAYVWGQISEHVNTARANNGLNKSQVVPIMEKGAKIGSAGYEIWLAKKRTHNKNPGKESTKPSKVSSAPLKPLKPAGKPKTSASGKYSKFIAKKPLTKPKLGKTPKSKLEKKGY